MSPRPMVPTTPSRRPGRSFLPVLLVGVLAACGGDAPAPGGGEASSAGPATATDDAGTLLLGSETLPFRVVRCAPAAEGGDGLHLRGTGTAPDGRRMSVEVERLPDGEIVDERVTVVFGSIMEGDTWGARAHRFPDGSWSADEAVREPLDGPLLEVEGPKVRASGTFRNGTSGQARDGRLTATCPS